MNHKFDELAKGLAQSVTRRQALKRFGVGLAGAALACFGLASEAKARKSCLASGYLCYEQVGTTCNQKDLDRLCCSRSSSCNGAFCWCN